MEPRSCLNCRFLDIICKIVSTEHIDRIREVIDKLDAFDGKTEDHVRESYEVTAKHCKYFEVKR